MNKAYELFKQIYGDEMECAIQEKNLREAEKEAFIDKFPSKGRTRPMLPLQFLEACLEKGLT